MRSSLSKPDELINGFIFSILQQKRSSFLTVVIILFSLLSCYSSVAQSFSIIGDSVVCENEILNYIAVPQGNYNYVWGAIGGTTVASSADTGTIQWANPHQGTVTLIVYDSSGTTLLDTVSLDVSIHYIPHPVVIPSADQECTSIIFTGEDERDTAYITIDSTVCNTVCGTDTITYSAGGGALSSTYTWQIQGDYIYAQSYGSYIEIVWDTIGYGMVILEETTAAGCIGTSELCVEVVRKPIANFTTDFSGNACVNAPLHFFDQSTDAVYWEWDFGDGTPVSTEQNPTHVYTTSGGYSFTLTVRNACGCIDTLRESVDVLDAPSLELDCINPVCPGIVSTYTLVNNNPNGINCSNYTISVTDGTLMGYDPATQTFEIQWSASAGPEDEVITVSSPGCFNCDLHFYIPVMRQTATITGEDTLCIGQQEKYSIPLWPGTFYDWQIIPATAGTFISMSGNNEMIIEWNASATAGAQIKVVYQHYILDDCATGQAELDVTVLPEYEVDGEYQLCGDTVTAPYTISSLLSGSGSFDYTITQTQTGTPVSTGSFTGPNFNLTFNGAGNYLVKISNTSGDYCEPDYYFNVKVYPHPVTPNIAYITGEDEVCPNVPFAYGYTATLPQPYYLRWYALNGSPDSTTANAATITWDAGAPNLELYAVFIMKNEPSCRSDSAIFTVDYKDLNPALISGGDSTCNNSSRQYTDTGDGDDYNWTITPSTAGAITSGQGSAQVQIQWNNYTGFASISVDRLICGTIITDTLTVELTNVPPVTIVSADSLCQNQAETFSVSSIGTIQSYSWNFGALGTSSLASPSVTYNDTGSFSVNVAVYFPGCQVPSTDQKMIFVRPAPAAFVSTPNQLNMCAAPTLYATMQGLAGATNTFQWFSTSGGAIGGATSSTYAPPSTGEYYVVATSSGLTCTATSNSVTINDCDTTLVPGPGGCDPAHQIIANVTHAGCGLLNINPTLTNGTIDKVDILDGVHHIYYSPTIPSQYQVSQAGFVVVQIEGTTISTNGVDSCEVDTIVSLEIPLIADFTYGISCGPNNTYTYDFFNTTTYLPGDTIDSTLWYTPPFTYLSVNFHYSHDIAAGTTENIALWVMTTSGEICTTTKSITAPDKPEALFSPTQPACEDQAVAFTDLSTGNLTSWYWDYGAGMDAYFNGNSFYTYEDPSSIFVTYTASLTVTDEYGCSDQYDTAVVVNAYPFGSGDTINPQGPVMSCPGNCVDIEFYSGQSNLTYLWSTLDNTSTVEACQTGGYQVTVTQTSTGCIARRGPAHVGFYSLPQPVILGDSILCLDETYRLLGNVGDELDYWWYNASGTLVGTTPNIDWYSGGTSGNSYLDLVVENAYGCADTGRFNYTVNPDIGPQITTGNFAPLCEMEQVEFGYTLSNPPANSILWSNGYNSSTITANVPGPYVLTTYDDNGCTSTDTAYVGEKPNVSNFLCGCYTFCIEDTVMLQPIPGSFEYFEWLVDGTVITGSNGYGFPIIPHLLGTHNYQMMAMNPNGCIDTSCISEITLVQCVDESPCDIYPCAGCNITYEAQVDSCVGTDVNGDPIYAVSVWLSPIGFSGSVFAVEDPNGNAVPFNATNLTANTPTLVPVMVTVPGAGFPYCIDFYVLHNDSLCKVNVCINIDPGNYPCPGNKARTAGWETTEETVRLYPNPAGDALNVLYANNQPEATATVAVYAVQGNKVYAAQNISGQQPLTISTTGWPTGLYLVQVKTANGNQQVYKITVVH